MAEIHGQVTVMTVEAGKLIVRSFPTEPETAEMVRRLMEKIERTSVEAEVVGEVDRNTNEVRLY
ncbi:hypothetical protein [Actinomadura rubrisoli]|uniref:Uncharacterized protein n=1 Tax=Actinomadura rubrisoli TaxID=2530368 RepID=A0A4R5CE24_9ACTN|nr:hypothetical protein [Actinomadura rubrisoli]TDD97156.1 hypothetical protein E1298_01595 [Actinomadura rubrisoli]